MYGVGIIIMSAAVISLLLYSYLILRICYYWNKERSYENDKLSFNTKLSVILAVRNEEKNITKCLKCIENQSYSDKLYEVIIIDDSSTDNTVNIIESFIKNSHLKMQLIELDDNTEFGKKAAIKRGIEAASGTLIVTTDGDSVMSEKWLSRIVAIYEEKKAKMIIAPVMMLEKKSVFTWIQALEFSGLSIATGGSAIQGSPIMSNGANMTYERRAFYSVNGYRNDEKIASGDDVFLLHKFKNMFKNDIKYLKSIDATVYTTAQSNLRGFLHQRVRWVSKYSKYSDKQTKFTAFIVFITNISLIISGIFGLCYWRFVEIFILQFILKALIDFLLLFLAVTFFRKRKLLLVYFPTLLFEFIYTTIVVIWSIVVKEYKWKGRKVI